MIAFTERDIANLREDSGACGYVSHEEAYDILIRFTHRAFGRSGTMPILSIPADPKRDSGLRMAAYIYQCYTASKGSVCVRDTLGAPGIADTTPVPLTLLTADRIAECKKICACVPFIDGDAGVSETMAAMRDLIEFAEATIGNVGGEAGNDE